MVDAVMVPSCNSNCKDDIDDFLLTLGSINKKKHVQPLLPSPTAYDVMVKQLPENLKSLLKVGPLPVEGTDPLSKQEKKTPLPISVDILLEKLEILSVEPAKQRLFLLIPMKMTV